MIADDFLMGYDFCLNHDFDDFVIGYDFLSEL
jgi:hypothetical protein